MLVNSAVYCTQSTVGGVQVLYCWPQTFTSTTVGGLVNYSQGIIHDKSFAHLIVATSWSKKYSLILMSSMHLALVSSLLSKAGRQYAVALSKSGVQQLFRREELWKEQKSKAVNKLLKAAFTDTMLWLVQRNTITHEHWWADASAEHTSLGSGNVLLFFFLLFFFFFSVFF